MGQPQHGYTTRTARAEARPEDSGISSGRLRATRGCRVSRAARHKGTRDPDKQPHHHQKQRQSGGRCTRSEEVHCLRIGCSAPTHKNKRGTGKPSHSPATTSPSTGRQAGTGRMLSSFVAPSTHTVPEHAKNPGLVPRGIELPPVSWTSKLKSREWEAFRACGCAVEA